MLSQPVETAVPFDDANDRLTVDAPRDVEYPTRENKESVPNAPVAATAANSGGVTGNGWGPLLIAFVALFGSLGANLFLGYSYMDVRSKYLALLRKSARSFRTLRPAA